MVTITFPDHDTESRALGLLMGQFSGSVSKNGEHKIPEAALEALARENVSFTVKGIQGHYKPNDTNGDIPCGPVAIKFLDRETEFAALEYVTGRFSVRLLKGGNLILSPYALESLAAEKLTFTVLGRATYEQMVPSFRGTASSSTKRRVSGSKKSNRRGGKRAR
jgi:hypothetical protein